MGKKRYSTSFTLGEEPPVPIGYVDGWVTEPVWNLWSREVFASARNRTMLFSP
jgi:hypothetical protein